MDSDAPQPTQGRSVNFSQGTQSTNGVAHPGTTVAPVPVRPQSVLQPVSSSGTGLAEGDRQRALQGTPSPNGQSTTTSQLTTQRKYPFTQI